MSKTKHALEDDALFRVTGGLETDPAAPLAEQAPASSGSTGNTVIPKPFTVLPDADPAVPIEPDPSVRFLERVRKQPE